MSARSDRVAGDRDALARDVAATTCVMGFSTVIVIGFCRVFTAWEFLGPLLLLVVVGHGASFVLRRAHVRGWLAVPILTLLLADLVVRQHYGTTYAGLLPSAETWSTLRIELELVRDQFTTTTAPVVFGAGWAFLASAGMAAAVLLADTFAFRADARVETLVPGGVLFVFVGALGTDRGRIVVTGLLVAVGYLAVVALRRHHRIERAAELQANRSPRELVAPTMVGTAVALAIVAGVIGPRLPGAGADPLLETRGRTGGVTEVISPLVDIRSRLVSQSDNEMFRVNATEESYWRATTLPEFDGTTFRLPTRSLQRIDGAFGTARPGASVIRQDIEIAGLGGQLLPAAADPFEASGTSLRWNPDTSTLVYVGGELERGATFTVVSSSPRLQPSELRTTSSAAPPDPIYLDLPPGFPDSVRQLAAEVTDGVTTTYDQALALQTFFRTEFRYSLEVPAGHGTSAIEVFLRQRVGYCEQFAATFAAMARAVGLPSRVAVGYTAGIDVGPDRYSVLGRHAHAWPEVWFDGVGWVPFEPTPGRGAPGTEQYTGVAPAQDDTVPAPRLPSDDEFVPTPETTIPRADRQPDELDDLAFLFPDPFEGQSSGTTAPASIPQRSGPSVGLLVALAALVVGIGPAVMRRAVGRVRSRQPGIAKVTGAWQLVVRAARAAGVPVRSSMTTHEQAAAIGAALPGAARPARSLADVVDAVVYGPPGLVDLEYTGEYGENLGRDCMAWARQIDAIASDRVGPSGRAVRYLAFWR